MGRENEVEKYNNIHPACFTNDQLGTFAVTSAIVYLTLLLIIAYLSVKFVNWTNLVKYKYDLTKTLFVTIILLVTVNILFMLLDFKIMYTSDILSTVVIAMILMAYTNFGMIS